MCPSLNETSNFSFDSFCFIMSGHKLISSTPKIYLWFFFNNVVHFTLCVIRFSRPWGTCQVPRAQKIPGSTPFLILSDNLLADSNWYMCRQACSSSRVMGWSEGFFYLWSLNKTTSILILLTGMELWGKRSKGLQVEWWLSPLTSINIHRFTDAAAAVAKSLQSCPTLCNPIDGSPPGSPVPRILQARTLEWVFISFSSAWKCKVKVKSLGHVWLFVTPWTAAYQAPLPMGFSRQEYWSGVPLASLIHWWQGCKC